MLMNTDELTQINQIEPTVNQSGHQTTTFNINVNNAIFLRYI